MRKKECKIREKKAWNDYYQIGMATLYHMLDIDLTIPLTCHINYVGEITGNAPVA